MQSWTELIKGIGTAQRGADPMSLLTPSETPVCWAMFSEGKNCEVCSNLAKGKAESCNRRTSSLASSQSPNPATHRHLKSPCDNWPAQGQVYVLSFHDRGMVPFPLIKQMVRLNIPH